MASCESKAALISSPCAEHMLTPAHCEQDGANGPLLIVGRTAQDALFRKSTQEWGFNVAPCVHKLPSFGLSGAAKT